LRRAGPRLGGFRKETAIKAQIAFIFRYRIGALFPLRDLPQTMIVLARKR
jgi:hypothetical protein